MTDQNAPLTDGSEFVTEAAPSQTYKGAKRGRKPGTKNGEGKMATAKKAHLKAESVTFFEDAIMYVHLDNGVTVQYGETVTFDAGAAQLTAENVNTLAEVVKATPALPLDPSGVVEFGRQIGLGLSDFDTLTAIRKFIVK